MRHRKQDPNMPIGKLTRVADFLPPPHELVLPKETVKVTLLLSKSSIRFFKRHAAQHGTKYQAMIRALVDRYTEQHSH